MKDAPKKASWWKGPSQLSADTVDRCEKAFESIAKELDTHIADDPRIEHRVEQLINHFIELSTEIDNRRTAMLRASLQALAISAAGLGVIVNYLNSSTAIVSVVSYAIASGLAVIVITSLCIILTYHRQTVPSAKIYHFLGFVPDTTRALGNSPRWFYHGLDQLRDYPFTKRRNTSTDNLAATRYAEGLEAFVSVPGHYSGREAIRDNLRQAYVLLVHNAYKNKFDQQLISRFYWGVLIATVATLMTALIRGILLLCRTATS